MELLQRKLDATEMEVRELLSTLIEENVVIPKYTFQCRKCGEMNTFTDDMISENSVCQFCDKSININSYMKGAMVSYILNQNNFFEYLEEEGIEIPKDECIQEKGINNVIPFEANKEIPKVIKAKEKDSVVEEKKAHLFISHSTEDIEYIKCFVAFLEGLGFDEDNMFCSSIDGYGIKWGDNIYEYLAGQFNNEENELIVLFMLSDNYYKSPACLNEMGAAWVLKKQYRSILLPGFDFGDLNGAIDPRRLMIKLDDEKLSIKLNDVKNQLINIFGLKDVQGAKWDRLRDNLIDDIKRVMREQ